MFIRPDRGPLFEHWVFPQRWRHRIVWSRIVNLHSRKLGNPDLKCIGTLLEFYSRNLMPIPFQFRWIILVCHVPIWVFWKILCSLTFGVSNWLFPTSQQLGRHLQNPSNLLCKKRSPTLRFNRSRSRLRPKTFVHMHNY